MVAHLHINENKILEYAASTPQYNVYARQISEEIIQEATRIFNMRRKGPFRRSETSPPIYINCFKSVKIGKDWWAINTDPGALWVEFGAYAGGKTLVLKYRPLGLAADAVAARRG